MQGVDFTKLPRCVCRYLTLSRSPISYSDRSKCYLQEETLQTKPCAFKRSFPARTDNILKSGVLKPVHEATPCINSFGLVEGKNKFGNLKLSICKDPTNLHKVMVREPYHFKTPEDIAHLLADAFIMSVCNCKKGLLAPRA